MAAEFLGTVRLAFRDPATFAHVSAPVAENLSAAASTGDALFLSCDEQAGVERLTRDPEGPPEAPWQDHVHFNLGRIFDLPDGPDGEMDIEGLAIDAGWLWIAGSHALKRKKPRREAHGGAGGLSRMERIARDPNRFFLGRVPLATGADGHPEPAAEDGDRRAACVKFSKKASKLIRWLEDDPHLAPFLPIPSKENGFDIEGIAVRGMRVWLGLRGPVLRGHAVVLELELRETDEGRLKARRIEGKRRYRKHLLPTGGLGVRDLDLDGEDMLVLTGPTLGMDGPAHILRWRDATAEAAPGVVAEDALAEEIELPYRGQVDHPEGIAPAPRSGPGAWLIVHDSPAPERIDRDGLAVMADVVRPAGARG